MNVLSLFDGMSCGQIALNRAGIKYDNYFASEVDRYAIKVTMTNYPNTIQLGDIKGIKIKNLPKIGLLLGGSPCQGFSCAGKHLNFNDPKSELFFEFVRILRSCNPKYFLFENVVMKKEWVDIITEYLGVNPVFIDSAYFTAAHRKRLYWTSIPIGRYADRKLVLADVIKDDFAEYLIDITDRYVAKKEGPTFKKSRASTVTLDQKHYCLTANGQRISNSGATNIEIGSKYYCATAELSEVLQTVPNNYTLGVSNTQRHKMLGNGWTVDVIVHIFQGLLNDLILATYYKEV